MGTTHRIYQLKHKPDDPSILLADMRLIYNSLCQGEHRTFYYNFGSPNLNLVLNFQSQFVMKSYDMMSKCILNSSERLLNVFDHLRVFNRISISNSKTDEVKRDYLHYWIWYNTNPDSLAISIVLPITEDFFYIKSSLKDVFFYLNQEKVIHLHRFELEGLVNQLIDESRKWNQGYSFTKTGVTFSATGSFQPKNSKQVRPASIQLKFDADYVNEHNGMADTLKTIYATLNGYFKGESFKVEGCFQSGFEEKSHHLLTNLGLFDITIRNALDLTKSSGFGPEHLQASATQGSSIEINNFDWKDSEPNHLSNRVGLYYFDNEWGFELDIDKYIHEDYYFNIELLINKELEYQYTQ